MNKSLNQKIENYDSFSASDESEDSTTSQMKKLFIEDAESDYSIPPTPKETDAISE